MDHPEGIYLRKYQPLSALTPGSQSDRIFWYQDIIRALLHLHKLGISHSDIRKDNILFDQQGHALLGDFCASCPFGHPNPSLPVLFNGPSETVSDATDRFAMGSLIYELETGVRSEISLDDHDGLILPKIHTAHDGLDSLIENAWRGQYDSTTDMLKHAECLNTVQDSRGPVEHPVSKTKLIARIAQWRKNRAQQHGNLAINENDTTEPGQQCILGCVLYSLPTEPQLQILAERYGWSMDEELRFRDDSFIFSKGETPS
ncbi:Ribosomal protein S6 kinase alpha-5 [Beauveria bassiana]|nr:Ribosomal protein S6 kinase alpha-5 [Beauveria bassiana]